MPTVPYQLPPLDLASWQRVLRKYRSTAARGPDGVSHEDLKHMAPCQTQGLLAILSDVESLQADWPDQLKTGLCLALAKSDHACTAEAHRPIVVFSICYRTWAALRAKQLTYQLLPYLPPGEFGFLPSRETGQYWLCLQASVEHMLQLGLDFAGLSTDLRRAFNTISRPLTAALGAHMGVPDSVMVPWQSFLRSCQRRFQLGNTVSSPAFSSTGVPEGDSLSVFAMIQLDAAFHKYMQVFAPGVRSLSYVDNLALSASRASDLAQGWVTLESFFQLWGMSTDTKKTYAWALTPPTRSQLKFLGFTVLSTATELGGAMNFGGRHSSKHVIARSTKLAQRWQRLKRSTAPLLHKQASLYLTFWPTALHGTGAVRISQAHLQQLRGKATKALGQSKAGASGLLRLSLAPEARCDPGFTCSFTPCLTSVGSVSSPQNSSRNGRSTWRISMADQETAPSMCSWRG